jgi:hypothetical protein
MGNERCWLCNKNIGTASGLFYPEDRMHTRRLEGGNAASFRYTEPYYLHFKYRHLIDDHNAKRHAVPAIETSLVTTHLGNAVLSISLGNFGGELLSLMQGIQVGRRREDERIGVPAGCLMGFSEQSSSCNFSRANEAQQTHKQSYYHA